MDLLARAVFGTLALTIAWGACTHTHTTPYSPESTARPKRAALATPTLSGAEKAADMRHLLGLARNAFPYLDAIRTIKGLEPLKGRDWVTLARETPGNPSFILLVAELVQRLEQGTGHMDIVSPWTVSGPKELELLCRRYQTTERSIRLQKPWWDLLRRGARRTHAAFRVAYRGGEYVLTEGYRSGDHHLPPATAIAAVDGLEVHDYVKTLFGQRWLRYDADRRRLYAPGGSPFEVPGARDATSWRVRFRIDEEQEVTLDIPKRTREKTRPSKKRTRIKAFNGLTCRC